ncbi:phage tail tape measure protein [Kosakonia sp. S58]|uniref:phage tail tape measure protein n=1 Tax=unclassified Kosakonia TaxID=2632876 RepID=UPI001903334C|nr:MULTISPECIES: phage tail tape measure protein [unclassified Kosakonia]MBK0080162.1 phage tail tape measure protein [Kosakonia sp. S57]MBK0086808.1 phage tail tape measure protein [Kosakonia sp. S58]
MSNSAKLEELLTAVDQATRPFQSLQTESLSLSDSVKGTEKNLRGLYTQLAQVDDIMRAEKALASVNAQLSDIKQNRQNAANGTAAPAIIDPWSGKPKSEKALKKERLTLRRTIKANKTSLKTAGIDARTPLSARLQLNSRISDESAQLITQRQALKQEQHQKRQLRAAKIQAVQQRILGAGEKISTIGEKSKSIATTGFELGKKIMQPGYEASLKNSPLAPAAASDNAEPGAQNSPLASGTAVATLQKGSGTAVATLQNSTGAPGTAVAALQNSAAGPAAAMQSSVGNLGTDLEALQAAYQSLSVDIFSTQESSLRSLVQTATRYVGKLQEWVQNNQGLVQSFGLIATVVVGIAGAVGTVAGVIAPVFTGISTLITIATTLGSVFTTIFGGIAALFGSLTLPIIAVVAAIVFAIYKYWEPISAFFGGVIEGIKTAFAPIAELFAPFQPLFDGIGKAISNIAGWFGDLLTPVKSSQQTLENCGNAGKMFGQVLVTALTWPLKSLKLLNEGVEWLLNKLGVINKQSADASPDKQTQPTTGGAAFGMVQPPRLDNYQAARPATGGSYVDQSKSEYNITLQGDMSPGGDGTRQLRDLLAQHEQEKRTNSLSQFSAAGGFAS